eukprot:576356-Pelagomonas_calceolata.AAC.1
MLSWPQPAHTASAAPAYKEGSSSAHQRLFEHSQPNVRHHIPSEHKHHIHKSAAPPHLKQAHTTHHLLADPLPLHATPAAPAGTPDRSTFTSEHEKSRKRKYSPLDPLPQHAAPAAPAEAPDPTGQTHMQGHNCRACGTTEGPAAHAAGWQRPGGV